MAFEWHQKIPLRLKLIGQDILLLPGTSRRTRLKYHLNIFQEVQKIQIKSHSIHKGESNRNNEI